MSSQLDNLRLNYKIWLESDDSKGILGDKKCELLKAIDETGSLNDAMKKLNLTYRKTWENLRKIERELGFALIKPTRGGADGGNTVLTAEAKILIQAFDRFHAEYDQIIQQGFEKIWIELKNQIDL
jgi:molybdate transport repressor ModE-like protein